VLFCIHVQVNELNNGIEDLQRAQEILRSNLNKAEKEVLILKHSQYNYLCNKKVDLMVTFSCMFPSRLSCFSTKTKLLTKQTKICIVH
jgi:hypothetical protein